MTAPLEAASRLVASRGSASADPILLVCSLALTIRLQPIVDRLAAHRPPKTHDPPCHAQSQTYTDNGQEFHRQSFR
jgi:hypothetical protein